MGPLRDVANIILGFSLALNTMNLHRFLTFDMQNTDAKKSRRTDETYFLFHHHQDHIKKNFIQSKKRLEFVHIPKSAGTAVENAALKQGVVWGYYHFATVASNGKPYRTREARNFMLSHNKLPPWHIPTCMLDHQDMVPNPYHHHHDVFAIVRNPYERAISEYHYACMMIRQKNARPLHMNQFLSNKLEVLLRAQEEEQRQQQQSIVYESCVIESHSPDYFLDSGHWIPQYDFVFRTHNNNQTMRLVRHVIKYENLDQEFARLMKLYGLQHIQLAPKRSNDDGLQEDRTRANTPEEQYRVQIGKLSSDNIRLINLIYKRDFEAFGYSMMDPSEGLNNE